MLQQNHMNTLRQTHRTITTVMPLVTAALAVTGALIGAMDRSERGGLAPRQSRTGAPFAADEAEREAFVYTSAYDPMFDDEHDFSWLSYAITLVSRMFLVALGFALVAGLAWIALRVGTVGVAIELTALILLTLYLAEKVTRRARRQARLVRRGRAATRVERMRHATHTAQAAQPAQAPRANATGQTAQAGQAAA